MTDASAIEMIRQSAEGIADRRDLARVRAMRWKSPGFDRAVWREMCELGWPALRIAEERGGVGLGIAAQCALAEELGAALSPEPLIGAALAARLLDDGALGEQLSGATLVLPAWQEDRDADAPASGFSVADGRITGRRIHVQHAAGADFFLAVEPAGSWLVEASDPGVRLELLDTQDGGNAGNVVFDGAAGRRIDADPGPALAEACLATSAYLLGLMSAALDRTIDYLGTRVQFGKPIGTFQALQHRAVDLRLQVELTRASIEDAARQWDEDGATDAAYAAISRAKARASEAALAVTRSCIQLHGGIGFTDEHDIGLYLRKAMVVAPQFGGSALHRARYARLLPAGQEA